LALAMSASSWCCSVDEPIRATREFAVSAHADGISKVAVRNRIGAVLVRGSIAPDVRVQVVVKVRAAGDARAAVLAAKVQVQSAREGDTLKVYSLSPDLEPREQIEVDLEVSVPWPRIASGESSATQPAARLVDCQLHVGEVIVRDVDAAVRTELTTGTTRIQCVAGPVDVESKTGTVRIEGADDRVTVIGGTGDYDVADVRGPVSVTATKGRIHVHAVKPIFAGATDASVVSAHVATGSVKIEDVTGDVQASTNTGTVRVSDVRGTVDAHSNVGQVIQDPPEGPACGG
jgi:hypothetical protein